MQDESGTDDDMFLKAVGGWSDKGGIVSSFDDAAELYYKRPLSSTSSSSSSSGSKRSRSNYVQGLERHITELTQVNEQQKLLITSQREHLDQQQLLITSQQEQLDEITQQMRDLKKQMEDLTQVMKSNGYGDIPTPEIPP